MEIYSYLIDKVSVSAVLREFGIEERDSAEGKYFICPVCKNKAHYIDDLKVRCGNTKCTLQCGDIFDLSKVFEGGRYTNAVDRVLKIADQDNYRIDRLKLSMWLSSRRRLFDIFLSKYLLPRSNYDYLIAKRILKVNDLVYEQAARYVFSPAQYKELRNLVYTVYEVDLPDIQGHAVVLPMFADASIVSGALVMTLSGSKAVHWYDSIFNYLNLFDPKSRLSGVLFSDNLSYALQESRQYCTVVFKNRILNDIGIKEIAVTNILDSVQLFNYLSDISIYDLNTKRSYSDVKGFLVSAIKKELTTGTEHISPYIKGIVNSLILDPSVVSVVCKEFATTPSHYIEVTNLFLNKLLFVSEDGKYKYYQSSDGYYMEGARGAKTHITNFILAFDSVIIYPEKSEIFYTGQIVINNQTQDFEINKVHFDNPTEIEKQLQLAAFKCKDASPVILSRIEYKEITSKYLKPVFEYLPKKQGIDMLGWNFAKTIYQAPFFKITGNKVEPTSPHFHQSLEFSEHLGAAVCDDTPIDTRVLLAYAGYMFRSFFNLPAYPIKLQSDLEVSVATAGKTLGQLSSIDLDRINMNCVESIHGFPLIAKNSDSLSRTKSELIAIESGAVVTNTDAKMMSAFEFVEIIKKLILFLQGSRSNLDYTNPYRSVYVNDAVTENGRFVLNELMKLDIQGPFTAPHGSVDKYLSDKSAAVSTSVIHDFTTQRLILKDGASYDMGDELTKLGISSEVSGLDLRVSNIGFLRYFNIFFDGKATTGLL